MVTYSVDKAVIRLLPAMTAAKTLHKRYHGIESAYIAESYDHPGPLYIKKSEALWQKIHLPPTNQQSDYAAIYMASK